MEMDWIMMTNFWTRYRILGLISKLGRLFPPKFLHYEAASFRVQYFCNVYIYIYIYYIIFFIFFLFLIFLIFFIFWKELLRKKYFLISSIFALWRCRKSNVYSPLQNSDFPNVYPLVKIVLPKSFIVLGKKGFNFQHWHLR